MQLSGPPRRPATTLVETAIVLNVTFLLLFAIFEYGRFVFFRQVLDNAAREGARLAVVSTNSLTTADIEAEVRLRLAGQSPSGLAIQVYKINPTTGTNLGAWTDAAFGESIAVNVTGQYPLLFPSLGFLPSVVNMSTRSVMRSEAN